ncbi:hypothetical protein AMS68_004648 [Peltaster fructicola]|uniref:Uncharacterized protein n=1 Tax=Peltaster fructicola TaxID=286661 RepID=A0A6H0XWU4_9PEZI|nr:hypothetical protein AMS68_004648 [Peltaster fructicola]
MANWSNSQQGGGPDNNNNNNPIPFDPLELLDANFEPDAFQGPLIPETLHLHEDHNAGNENNTAFALDPALLQAPPMQFSAPSTSGFGQRNTFGDNQPGFDLSPHQRYMNPMRNTQMPPRPVSRGQLAQNQAQATFSGHIAGRRLDQTVFNLASNDLQSQRHGPQYIPPQQQMLSSPQQAQYSTGTRSSMMSPNSGNQVSGSFRGEWLSPNPYTTQQPHSNQVSPYFTQNTPPEGYERASWSAEYSAAMADDTTSLNLNHLHGIEAHEHQASIEPAAGIRATEQRRKCIEEKCNKFVAKKSSEERCSRCHAGYIKRQTEVVEYQLDGTMDFNKAYSIIFPVQEPIQPKDGSPQMQEHWRKDFERNNTVEGFRFWQETLLRAINRPYIVTDDEARELGRSDGQHKAYVKNQRTWINKHFDQKAQYNDDKINARLVVFLENVKTLYTGGVFTYDEGGDNNGYNNDRSLTFTDRMNRICDMLSLDKRACTDLVEGRGSLAFLRDPHAYEKRKQDNVSSNDKKAAQRKLGEGAVKLLLQGDEDPENVEAGIKDQQDYDPPHGQGHNPSQTSPGAHDLHKSLSSPISPHPSHLIPDPPRGTKRKRTRKAAAQPKQSVVTTQQTIQHQPTVPAGQDPPAALLGAVHSSPWHDHAALGRSGLTPQHVHGRIMPPQQQGLGMSNAPPAAQAFEAAYQGASGAGIGNTGFPGHAPTSDDYHQSENAYGTSHYNPGS